MTCDEDIDEILRDGHSAYVGVVVPTARWLDAGAPRAFAPFRPGYVWRPYAGERSTMSLIHYVPDIAVVPCLGCNELVTPLDLVESDRTWSSHVFWYPYHLWCTREQPPAPRSLLECGECGGSIAVDAAAEAIRWAATFVRRASRRLISATTVVGQVREQPDAVIPRPPAWRFVSVGNGLVDPVPPLDCFTGDDFAAERIVAGWFELVHDVCPVDDPWRARLRGHPADPELRLVYADWLEQSGDPRAELVRVAVARRRDAIHDDRLRALVKVVSVSPGWLRDVIRDC